jgi:hypothetical protein
MKEMMFYIPIFKYNICDWNKKKKKLLEIFSTIIFNKTEENKTSYYVEGNQKQNEKLILFLYEELMEFENEIKNQFHIKDVWLQEYSNKDHHSAHTHGCLGYSGILYIEYDYESHNSVNFISPFISTISGDVEYYKPDIKEGQIIIFPSNILHFVHPVSSSKSRKICGFNILLNEKNNYFKNINYD